MLRSTRKLTLNNLFLKALVKHTGTIQNALGYLLQDLEILAAVVSLDAQRLQKIIKVMGCLPQPWFTKYAIVRLLQAFNNIIYMKQLLLTFVWLVAAVYSQAGDYNHATVSNLVNTSWMTPLGDGIPLRKLSLMGTENSLNSPSWDLLYMGQTLSLTSQLTAGVRLFDLHVRHY